MLETVSSCVFSAPGLIHSPEYAVSDLGDEGEDVPCDFPCASVPAWSCEGNTGDLRKISSYHHGRLSSYVQRHRREREREQGMTENRCFI